MAAAVNLGREALAAYREPIVDAVALFEAKALLAGEGVSNSAHHRPRYLWWEFSSPFAPWAGTIAKWWEHNGRTELEPRAQGSTAGIM